MFISSSVVPSAFEIVSPVQPYLTEMATLATDAMTDSADVVLGDDSSNILSLLADNDTIISGSGDDWINGNQGDDRVQVAME